ncbi:hypothetical protein LINPERPRIM_LOCUS39733 [Linum perenne]
MGPFKFKFQTHFVASNDGTTLQVYELTEFAITHDPSSIQPKTHLKEVANIHPYLDLRTIITHTGLLFPKGKGRIEGREAHTLAQHLSQLRLLVNPNGYCLQDVIQLRMYTEFKIHYLRLNDLFQWSQYGVETSRSAQVEWNRTEFNHHRGGGPSSRPMSRYKVMSKVEHYKWEKDMRDSKEKNEKQRRKTEEKGSEFERRLKEKDEEIESTRHDLKRVSEMTAEFPGKQDSLEKKESEIEKLKKEKEEAEEYLKSLKQTVNHARSYLPEPAVVADNVKKTAAVIGNVASAAGSAAYTAGKATAQTAAAVGSYLYKYTPAARAEAERQRKMYKNLNKRENNWPPPKG